MSGAGRGTRVVGLAAVATVAAAMTLASSASAYKRHRSPDEREEARLRAESSPSTAVDCNHNAGNAVASVNCQMAFISGPLISNVNVVPVFWTYSGKTVDSNVTSWAPAYLSALVDSPYLDLLAEYSTGGQSVTRGTTSPPYTITPTTATGATVADKSITKELAAQVTAGMLPPVTNDAAGKANTLYVIFFPPGVTITDPGGAASCTVYCGYHGSGTSGGKTYLYAVIPDLSQVQTYTRSDGGTVTEPCGYGCAYQAKTKPEVEWFNGTISHELAEAVSDPVGGNGWYDNANQDYDCGGSLSTSQPGGGEIGDVCVGFWDDSRGTGSCEDTLPVPGKNIAAQQLWSNALGGCYVANSATPVTCPPSGCVDGGPGPLTPGLDAGADDASPGPDAATSDDAGQAPSDASLGTDSTISGGDAGSPVGDAGGPTGSGGGKSGCSCGSAPSSGSSSLALGGALMAMAALGQRRLRRRR